MRRFLALSLILSILLLAIPASAAPSVPVFSRAKTTNKVVALTFDDGWSATASEQVRQILKLNDIRATIFPAAAWAKSNPEMMARFVADGHEFGNHTLTHPNLTKLDQSSLRTEIAGAADILRSLVSSRHTAWFRPPYGAYNATTLQLAAELGLKVVLWSVDSWDWREVSPFQVVQRVLGSVRPGAVILMHLGGRNTVAALPDIISGLRSAGYAFVTLSELASLDEYGTADPLLTQHVSIVQSGQTLALNPEAILLAGKAYVPCRPFLGQAGFQVQWQEQTQTASFQSANYQLIIKVGSAVASCNGHNLQLHGQAAIIAGSLYAPIRPLAEALGFDVSWDQATRSVALKKLR